MTGHESHAAAVAQKDTLRERLRAHRRELTDRELSVARDGLTAQLITLVERLGARSVACYYPIRNEPDTRPFLTWCRERDIRVLVPSCREDLLLDWIEMAGDETVPGRYSIPEPVGAVFGPIEVNSVDVMLVPAAAVDRHGTRLGWGGGFFDRTLGSMDHRPPVYAVLYDGEIVDELPRELHDCPVTGAVTPSAIVESEPC